jgi:N-acetylglutamate synthase-like GNAT family acetyltransferase
MDNLILVKHVKGAPGLRLFGLGSNFMPRKGVTQLKYLFDYNTSWAKNRSKQQIKKILSNSDIVVTGWHYEKLIAFGRANLDCYFRAILWDIIVDQKYRKLGIGTKIVEAIINNPNLLNIEKVYLMTTQCEKFYQKIGFKKETSQQLMILKNM